MTGWPAKHDAASGDVAPIETPTPGQPSDLLIVVSVAASLGQNFFGAAALPLLLGSITDRLGLRASQVGLLGTLELAAIAVAAMGIAPVVARRSRVAMAIVGCILTAAGQFMTAAAVTFSLLALSRVIAGLGMGVAAGAAQAAVAASMKPDRVYGMYFAVSTALGTVLLLLLPQLLSAHGYLAGYSTLGAIALVAIPLAIWLPPPPLTEASSGTPKAGVPRRAIAIPALIALALIAASDYGLWTFIERIGAHAGMSPEGIGETLAIATLAGSASAALTAWAGARLGRIIPVLVSFSIMTAVAAALAKTSEPQPYVALLIVWCASLFIAYSYVMGGLAAADSSGRLSALAAGTRSVGAAIGPTVAGFVVAAAGYQKLGLMVASWCVTGLLLSIPLTLYLTRRGTELIQK
jgi:predicted MFS family arabinose efflux permease